MDLETAITLVKELGSFGVLVWLLLVEIPQFRATIQRNTEAIERVHQAMLQMVLSHSKSHEPLSH